mgnify:FL=1
MQNDETTLWERVWRSIPELRLHICASIERSMGHPWHKASTYPQMLDGGIHVLSFILQSSEDIEFLKDAHIEDDNKLVCEFKGTKSRIIKWYDSCSVKHWVDAQCASAYRVGWWDVLYALAYSAGWHDDDVALVVMCPINEDGGDNRNNMVFVYRSGYETDAVKTRLTELLTSR